MIIAENLRPAVTRGAVRVDESLRVDFEMPAALQGHIGGGPGLHDQPTVAEQDSAAFVGHGAGGLGEQSLQNRS